MNSQKTWCAQCEWLGRAAFPSFSLFHCVLNKVILAYFAPLCLPSIFTPSLKLGCPYVLFYIQQMASFIVKHCMPYCQNVIVFICQTIQLLLKDHPRLFSIILQLHNAGQTVGCSTSLFVKATSNWPAALFQFCFRLSWFDKMGLLVVFILELIDHQSRI